MRPKNKEERSYLFRKSKIYSKSEKYEWKSKGRNLFVPSNFYTFDQF